MVFVGNLFGFPAVKEFWKSVNNWQSYRYEFGVLLFWNTVYDGMATRRWKILKICSFVLTEFRNVTNGRTDGRQTDRRTPHDGIGRAGLVSIAWKKLKSCRFKNLWFMFLSTFVGKIKISPKLYFLKLRLNDLVLSKMIWHTSIIRLQCDTRTTTLPLHQATDSTRSSDVAARCSTSLKKLPGHSKSFMFILNYSFGSASSIITIMSLLSMLTTHTL